MSVQLSAEDLQIAGKEVLECARYGELAELKEMFQSILPKEEQTNWDKLPAEVVNFKDFQGSTGLHRACANGHAEVVGFLLEIGAEHIQNSSGNTPLHWAVQNKQLPAVKLLCEKVGLIDVLQQNNDGKSSLTNGFDVGDTEILKLLLEHSSAEALQKNKTDGGKVIVPEGIDEDEGEGEEEIQTFTHEVNFGSDTTVICREIGFNTGKLDEKDNLETTGAAIWAASLILSRWIIKEKHIFDGKSVVELGAGCGLPGLTAYRFCKPSKVVITDLMSKTFDNLQFNVKSNLVSDDSSQSHLEVQPLDWCDESTWPSSIVDGQTQMIIGSDLVYSLDLVAPLINTILNLLDADGGCFLYVTTDTSRAGFPEFCNGLKQAGFSMKKRIAPKEFLVNPLKSQDKAAFDLHFGEIYNQTFHMYTFVRTK